MADTTLGGTYSLPHTSIIVNRMGYGAMQLAGPHVFGPPKDRAACLAVLRAAIEAGVDHIDTSDFYGPHVTNQIIREALHPYPEHLTIVTKVGASRDEKGAWLPAQEPQQLIDAVHDNLRNLGLDVLDVVNLRVGPPLNPFDGPVEPQLETLAELQRQGKIKHLGLSTVTPAQLKRGQAIAPIVCVQNEYNLAKRASEDAFIDDLNAQGIPYVPWFPLGGFTPLQASELDSVAKEVDATPMQVALAWLLHRSPNMVLIPGTSSVAHLKENLAAAQIELSPKALAELNAIGAKG